MEVFMSVWWCNRWGVKKSDPKGTVVGVWLRAFVLSISPWKIAYTLLELGLVCL